MSSNQDKNMESEMIINMPTIKDEDRQTSSRIPRVHYMRNICWILAGLVVMCLWPTFQCCSVFLAAHYFIAAYEMQSALLCTAASMTLIQGCSMNTVYINWLWAIVKQSRDSTKRQLKRLVIQDHLRHTRLVIFGHEVVGLAGFGLLAWMLVLKCIVLLIFNAPTTINPARVEYFQAVGIYGVYFNVAYLVHMIFTFNPIDSHAQKGCKLIERNILFAFQYCFVYYVPALTVLYQLSFVNILEVSELSKVCVECMMTFGVVTMILIRTGRAKRVYMTMALVQKTVDGLLAEYNEKQNMDNRNNLGEQACLRVRSAWMHLHQHGVIPVMNIHGMDLIVSSAKKLYYGPEHQDIELDVIDGVFIIHIENAEDACKH